MAHPSDIFQRYAFVSLGANLNSSIGSPQESVEYAITLIRNFSKEPLLVSSLLETEPLDCPPGSPTFINAVLGLIPDINETSLSLLTRLQSLENEVGRKRSGIVNEARVLDLDLITFKEERLSSERLILPHPRAHVRKFVLAPIKELVGNVEFPFQSKLIDELIDEL